MTDVKDDVRQLSDILDRLTDVSKIFDELESSQFAKLLARVHDFQHDLATELVRHLPDD